MSRPITLFLERKVRSNDLTASDNSFTNPSALRLMEVPSLWDVWKVLIWLDEVGCAVVDFCSVIGIAWVCTGLLWMVGMVNRDY